MSWKMTLPVGVLGVACFLFCWTYQGAKSSGGLVTPHSGEITRVVMDPSIAQSHPLRKGRRALGGGVTDIAMDELESPSVAEVLAGFQVGTAIQVQVKGVDALGREFPLSGVFLRVAPRSLQPEEGRVWPEATDENGSVWILIRGEGSHRVQLDASSLPAGFYPKEGTGFPIRRPRMRDEALRLIAYEGVHLAGRVVSKTDTKVQGLAGVRVQALEVTGSLDRQPVVMMTDEEGYFQAEELRPLRHALRLDVGCLEQVAPAGAVYPPPQFVSLEQGPQDGIEIVVGGGDSQVVGRVVDENAKPLPEIEVLAYYMDPKEKGYRYTWNDLIRRVQTRSDGSFQIAFACEAPLVVQVAPSGSRNGPPKERILRKNVEPMTVEPARHSSKTIDLGDIVVSLSNPYVVSGNVVLSTDVFEGKKLSMKDIELHAELPRISQHPFEMKVRPYISFERATGEFLVSCDTPTPQLDLVVRSKSSIDHQLKFSFYPISNQTEQELKLSFP